MIELPRGGTTKLDKLDLEACTFIDDELWAFGSGSLPNREVIVRVGERVIVEDAHVQYARLRAAVGALNIEGVVPVGDELWFFHRGNTSESDGPAIAICDREMHVKRVRRVDLGGLGFTDACAFGD